MPLLLALSRKQGQKEGTELYVHVTEVARYESLLQEGPEY